jgi:hypothetical protein
MGPRAKDASPIGGAGPTARGDLTGWRLEQLARAGFDAGLATCLAADPTMDLHALIELAERGCPPDLAARILAPLDREKKP